MTLSSLTPTLCSQGAVLVEQVGAVGVLTLHRPQALNALSLDMIRLLHEKLRIPADILIGREAPKTFS